MANDLRARAPCPQVAIRRQRDTVHTTTHARISYIHVREEEEKESRKKMRKQKSDERTVSSGRKTKEEKCVVMTGI